MNKEWTSGEFEKCVIAEPAYDKRHANPSKNYGIHGLTLRFYLRGPKGAIQFVIYTNWHLSHVQAEMDSKPLNNIPYMFHKPMPADIGYHAYEQRYSDQSPMDGACDVLDGATCYYDGSGLQAEQVFDVFVEGGTDALWDEMRRYYNTWLDTPTEQGDAA